MEKSKVRIQKVKTKQILVIKLVVTVIIVRVCSSLQWVACLIASVWHIHNELNLSRYFRRIFATNGFQSVLSF
jgi:hypothetical protein